MTESRTLKLALAANAIFSLASGTIFALFADTLAGEIGLPDGLALRVVGIGLLPFGAWVFTLSRSTTLTPKLGRIVSLLDAQWVGGTLILLLIWPDLFNATGVALAVVVALCVGTFASWQLYGARQLEALHQ